MKQVEVQAVITAGGYTQGRRYREAWDDARVAALVGAGYLHITQVIEVDDDPADHAVAAAGADGDLDVGVVGKPKRTKKVTIVKGGVESSAGAVDSPEGGSAPGQEDG